MYKFLGILIDENHNWKMQINNIKNKLYYGLSLLTFTFTPLTLES